MNAMVPANFGKLSPRFAGQKVENELAAGVAAGFGIISYRGKVWRIKHRGEERDIMRPDGDGPAHSIEVVVVRSATNLSKIYYKDGYKEGSTESPDCFSTNGLTPDISSKAKQANTCAGCPQNAWGSRITPAGKPGKACSDSKRATVVPLADLTNEAYGGPMLLRIPAASLQDAATYATTLAQLGYPLEAVATRIAFDTKEAYPKFVFSAIRPLTDAEADQVLALRNDPRVTRIHAESEDVAAAPAVTQQTVFEQPPAALPAPAEPAAAPATAKRAQRKSTPPAAAPAPEAAAPMTTAAPAPAAASSGTSGSSFDEDFDAMLENLLPS
jgi:hypothetical protein